MRSAAARSRASRGRGATVGGKPPAGEDIRSGSGRYSLSLRATYLRGRQLTITPEHGQPAISSTAFRSERAADALLAAAFLFALAIGVSLALNTGFSIDDAFEYDITQKNLTAIREFLTGTDRSLASLSDPKIRYYGVGFHLLSLPFRQLVAPLIGRYQDLAPADALLAAEHVATYLFFLFGGYCIYRILRLAGVGRRFAQLSVLFYLMNPYLLGHGTMNIKDTPFMVAWLLCTWRMLVPCMRLVQHGTAGVRDFLWLGAATGLLLSIRISGTLIVIQYLVALGVTAAVAGPALSRNRRELFKGIALFSGVAAGLTWLAYPVFWTAPLELFDAIRYMRQHPWGSCSVLWGRCLAAHDLPWFYVPGWLVVKVSLAGLLGFVFAAATVFSRPRAARHDAGLWILVLSALAIMLSLILTDVHLYNEIRQVLFLVPLIYLAAFVALAQRPRLGVPLLVAGLVIAAADNVKAYPYQYAWFNEPARLLDVSRDFETDYWALSSKELALFLRDQELPPAVCTHVPYPHQYSPYIPASRALCLSSSFWLQPYTPRPFLLGRILHTERQNYGTAPQCENLHTVQRRLFLSPRPIVLGWLQLCR